MSPVLEGICTKNDGSYRSFWGYENKLEDALEIPIGENNKFTGLSSLDGGQPTTFNSGRNQNVYTIDWDGSTNLVWKLGSKTATANSGETEGVCSLDEAELIKAFAFGANDYTRETPNKSGTSYIKIVQDEQGFQYSSSQGYGYTDITQIDKSKNNRGVYSGSNEIYDQFIGVKGGTGKSITFRIDLPNGKYRFVVAGGDAKYSGHSTTISVRDGNSGNLIDLVTDQKMTAGEFFQVGFGDKIPPPGDEELKVPDFRDLIESPTVEVKAGYLELNQTIGSGSNIGGDLCLFEIWSVE